MKLSILNTSWDLPYQEFSLELLLLRIEEAMKESGLHFSHLLVDGQAVYEEYEEFFEDTGAQLNEVLVVMKTTAELTADTLLSIREYLQRAAEELPSLAREFHQGPVDETWSRFSVFMEALQWLLTAFEQLAQDVDTTAKLNLSLYLQELQAKVAQLGEALEYKDFALTGDLLIYEIAPFFNECAQHLQANLDLEVIKHDLN